MLVNTHHNIYIILSSDIYIRYFINFPQGVTYKAAWYKGAVWNGCAGPSRKGLGPWAPPHRSVVRPSCWTCPSGRAAALLSYLWHRLCCHLSLPYWLRTSRRSVLHFFIIINKSCSTGLKCKVYTTERKEQWITANRKRTRLGSIQEWRPLRGWIIKTKMSFKLSLLFT